MVLLTTLSQAFRRQVRYAKYKPRSLRTVFIFCMLAVTFGMLPLSQYEGPFERWGFGPVDRTLRD